MSRTRSTLVEPQPTHSTLVEPQHTHSTLVEPQPTHSTLVELCSGRSQPSSRQLHSIMYSSYRVAAVVTVLSQSVSSLPSHPASLPVRVISPPITRLSRSVSSPLTARAAPVAACCRDAGGLCRADVPWPCCRYWDSSCVDLCVCQPTVMCLCRAFGSDITCVEDETSRQFVDQLYPP